MKTLIIIPAYNEEKNIENVVNSIMKYPKYDYIIVNDCSKDKTVDICKKNNYNYISLPSNLGIGGGVQAGYLFAVERGYDITVQFDGDGQHNAEYIEKMINTLQNEQFDMVIGSRFIEKNGFQSSGMRRLGINLIRFVIKGCCNKDITDATSGFRACSKRMTEFFSTNYAQDYPEPEAIVSAVLSGYNVKEIPVVMNERSGGISSINLTRSIYYMIKVSLSLMIYRLSIRKREEVRIYEH
ncbi:MAG TPA: glycosyltransferase family 2 protein [Clostridiales bacterium]|nr:glycosyltransferase family 2 protein [Clostridiales bacterium]